MKSVLHTVKTKVDKVVRNADHLETIRMYVIRMHKIKVHTTLFMKMYLLRIHHLANGLNNNGPDIEIDYESIINRDLVDNITVTVSATTNRGRRPKPETMIQRNALLQFYNEYYSHTVSPVEGLRTVSREHLTTACDYFSKELMTNYTNNITMHFRDIVKRYCECMLDKNGMDEYIRENPNDYSAAELRSTKSDFDEQLRLTINDMYCTNFQLVNEERRYNFQSQAHHYNFINNLRRCVLPEHVRLAPNNFDLSADLLQRPLRYFSKMITMVKDIESAGQKIFQIFPIVTNIIPGHLMIDTTTLLKILYPGVNDFNQYPRIRADNRNRSQVLENGFVANNKQLIWNIFFKTELKGLFHTNRFDNAQNPLFVPNNNNDVVPDYADSSLYTFHHQIETDGVDICISLVLKTHAKNFKPHNAPVPRGQRDPEDTYTHQTSPQVRQQHENFNIVGVDPNKRDLMYATNSSEKNNNQRKYRFTQDRRRKELDTKVLRRLMIDEKRATIIEGRSIEEHETDLSAHSSKTLGFHEFQAYCTAKNSLNQTVGEFYRSTRYRNRRFKSYMNKQKCDSKLIKDIQTIYGGPNNTLIAMGDWTEGNRHRRGHEPVKGIGFRKTLRRGGYKVFLVDEFRTSRMCCECQDENGVNEKFRRVKSPKPYQAKRKILCNGLLRCRTCKRLWNRDLNAAINIWNIAYNALHGHDRPFYLQRQHNQMGAADNEYDE